MRTRRFDGSDLRRVLIGMILNESVCARVSSQWIDEGLFDAKWANLIGGWAIRHYRRFGQPLNGQLRSTFEDWANNTPADDDTVKAVEKFLRALADSKEESTSDYLLDIAAKYFNKVRLKKEMALINNDLDQGRIDEAISKWSGVRKVQLGLGSYIQPADDFATWSQAFERDRARSLIRYYGAANDFFKGALNRGEFYSFMAPDKTGKTTFLIDLTFRALRSKNRVVYFDTGDSDADEINLLMGCRASRSAEFELDCDYPEGWDTEGVLQTKKEHIPQVDSITSYRKLKKSCKSPDAYRLSSHPNSSISIDDIDGLLTDWELDDWRPDVIVIDYADILAPPRGYADKLDQIDYTWQKMRRITQERHCLLVTATQASSRAYSRENGVLGKADFSGRKTKLAHVNGMIGINVTEVERHNQMARLNWIVRRKVKRSVRQGVLTLAGCFDIGNPFVLSRW